MLTEFYVGVRVLVPDFFCMGMFSVVLSSLNYLNLMFVTSSNNTLTFCRYALHFLVQSGISYCIMIIIGVESMHK